MSKKIWGVVFACVEKGDDFSVHISIGHRVC